MYACVFLAIFPRIEKLIFLSLYIQAPHMLLCMCSCISPTFVAIYDQIYAMRACIFRGDLEVYTYIDQIYAMRACIYILLLRFLPLKNFRGKTLRQTRKDTQHIHTNIYIYIYIYMHVYKLSNIQHTYMHACIHRIL